MNTKKTTQRQGFKTNEFIVYPSHGVGQIVSIEEQEVAGIKLELFVISFIKDKMTLRVPTAKIATVGMRKLAEAPLVLGRDAARKFLRGQQERICRDHSQTLRRDFLEQEAHGHEVVVLARAKDFFGLRKGHGRPAEMRNDGQ